jgi:hypothetical protein
MPRSKLINSRIKGKSGELELSRLTEKALGIKLTRNLSQSRSGGHDLECITTDGALSQYFACLAIEVKRSKHAPPAMRAQWWAQACTQAEKAGRVPLLAFRQDREGWRVQLLPLRFVSGRDWHDNSPCEVSLADFLTLARNAAAQLG